MRIFFNTARKALLFTSLLLISAQAAVFYFSQKGQTGLLLSVFLLLIIALALVSGPVVGLMSSLVAIFALGTFLIILFLRPGIAVNPLTVTLPELLIFGFVLLLSVLLAGAVHENVMEQHTDNRRLRNELRDNVAIDSLTGFDNRDRMEKELDMEISRTNRYKGVFTLILLQMDFMEDFQRLYGEKEHIHLLSSLAKKMDSVIRLTDRKFRYDENRFALVLTQTDDTYIDIVFDKLKEALQHHQLLNEKYVTLTFRAAYEVYTPELNMRNHKELFVQLESEMLGREL